ncbi:16S rRNA (uracil(1498)-N(3))-methyltransferase [Hydrogenophaga laconesensis]|uniref:Ribosomal RNA small subunit methyltransferase E n=1 Tax=Hydrogenophaga laconesensis TaxID=1805971 RepID=A0ABU1VJ57_9BURK|nr:16S rRNA (uracil(1498)-N(3))-methyltransferase [Hydrogenophaga laconesensis]MDR7097518.1 16S rRNA (uracil1498-N3)-methyltransferase [Hydrogenophaga laconesensis]
MPRFFCPVPLNEGQSLALPGTAARHVQVLRLQPGQTITLFNGEGGEWEATITRMGRSDVDVMLGAHHATEREPDREVRLALGMPANERMDWLVEKAAELGVAGLQPLHTAHSVLRLTGERATKKQGHWQSVAVAACEQCGGNRVPTVHAVADFAAWLKSLPPANAGELRCLLSLTEGTQPLAQTLALAPTGASVLFLSGPEGGLNANEDAQARAAGFAPVTLGPRVLRAETAALAALALAIS